MASTPTILSAQSKVAIKRRADSKLNSAPKPAALGVQPGISRSVETKNRAEPGNSKDLSMIPEMVYTIKGTKQTPVLKSMQKQRDASKDSTKSFSSAGSVKSQKLPTTLNQVKKETEKTASRALATNNALSFSKT